MTKVVASTFIVLVLSGILLGQNVRDLVPVRGHYQSFAKLDPTPTKERAEWDKLRFPRDEKKWEAF